MMRGMAGGLILGLAAWAGAAGAAEPVDARQTPIAARAVACLRQHAAEVSAATPTLADAADFLVTDVCAVEVELYRTYVANVRTLRQAQNEAPDDVAEDASPAAVQADWAQRHAALMAATVDPETAELKLPPRPSGSGIVEVVGAGEIMSWNSDPYLRAVAAEAILEARKAAH